MQNILCCFGTANPLSVSHSFDFDSVVASPPLSAAHEYCHPSCTHCLFMGRTSPPGRTSKYTPRTPHPQQQATPHTPGWTSSPPPAGLQINILIARLIYTASHSSLGRGRTSSLVRAASHTTPLCGSNHSLLPHP